MAFVMVMADEFGYPPGLMRGRDLRVIRAKLEMTQQQLADALGISAARLGDFERGYSRTRPRREVVIPKAIELACQMLLVNYKREHPDT